MPKVINNLKYSDGNRITVRTTMYKASKQWRRCTFTGMDSTTTKVQDDLFQLKDENFYLLGPGKEWREKDENEKLKRLKPGHTLEHVYAHDGQLVFHYEFKVSSENQDMVRQHGLRYCNRCDTLVKSGKMHRRTNQCKQCQKDSLRNSADKKKAYKTIKEHFKEFKLDDHIYPAWRKNYSFKEWLRDEHCQINPRRHECTDASRKDDPKKTLLDFMANAETDGAIRIGGHRRPQDRPNQFPYCIKPYGEWWWNMKTLSPTLIEWEKMKGGLRSLIDWSGIRLCPKGTTIDDDGDYTVYDYCTKKLEKKPEKGKYIQ